PATNPQTSQEPAARVGHNFGRMAVYYQPKLTVNAPNDVYEQEADRVAQEVVQCLTAPHTEIVQRVPAPEPHPLTRPAVRHPAPAIMPIAERAGGAAAFTVDPAVEAGIQQARGSGAPLPEQVREPMEQAFGHSFAKVRVHADPSADRLNRAVQARAFTT